MTTLAEDGIGELCVVNGLGNIILGGALGGAERFASVYDDGTSNIPVKVELLDSNYAVIAWERVRCTYVAAGDQLIRGPVMGSSNEGLPVNFGPGPKRCFVFLPSADVAGAVRYDVKQTLDSVEKVQAQTNIGLNLADPADSFWTLSTGPNGLLGDSAMCSGAAKVVSLRVFGASGLYTTNQDVANLPGAVDRLANDTDPLDAPIYILSGQTESSQNGARSAIIGGVGTWHVGVFVITSGAHIGDVWACYEGVAIKLPTTAGGMSIGGTVTGGTAGRVPYIGTGPVLAQEADFNYNSATHTLTVGPVSIGQAGNSGSIAGIANRSGYLLIDSDSADILMCYDNPSKRVMISGISGPGKLNVFTADSALVGISIKADPMQVADLLQALSPAGAVMSSIKADGSRMPASMSDAAATNNSEYLSTDSGKLSYKDAGGTVHALHA